MGLFGKKKKDEDKRSTAEIIMEETQKAVSDEPEKVEEKPKKKGFFAKLTAGLSKTRGGFLSGVFGGHDRIDEDFYEELEEAMILADMGMETTGDIMDSLRSTVKEKKLRTPDEAREALVSIIADKMRPDTEFATDTQKRSIILIVGVNGVGKTTSIGKLCAYYKGLGKTVMMAAADTFRAAAAEQLTEWSKRAGVPIVKHGEGADPAAVVFDAMASFNAKNFDLLICDTAGRLHNKKNLMDELAKIRRVIEREMPDMPIETLLVLDATTGQNAILQAKAFSESAKLTGLIITKLDGTAKGGVAVAVKDELGLPIRFVGVGEGIDDMRPFDADDFAEALLAKE